MTKLRLSPAALRAAPAVAGEFMIKILIIEKNGQENRVCTF